MDKIGKRLLLSAGIGLGVAVSGVSLYLLFRSDDDYESDLKNRSVTTSHQSVVTVKVPKEYVGAVIGRGGEQIKKIQSETKTRISSEDSSVCNNGANNSNNTNDNFRYLVIKGSQENTARAEMAINQIIAEQSLIVTKKFLIPTRAVGCIIGRNGDNIRYLMDKSGTKINVKKTDKKSTETLAPVSITGTTEQIEEAFRLINIEVEKNDKYLRNKYPYNQKQLANPYLLPIEDNMTDSELDFDNYNARLDPTSDQHLIKVFVSAVKSPNEFYVQIADNRGIQLDYLMEETTDFYENEDNRISFKPNEIKVGDLVAAPYQFDEHWYRARVTSLEDKPYSLQESKVGIFYLDYGDEAFVKYKQICCLKDDLLRRLPFQAIECSLSSVVPKYQIDWTEEAINCFKDLTHMALWKTLQAKLVEVKLINGKKEKYFIELIDLNPSSTNSNNFGDDWSQSQSTSPLNIGEELVRKGFAIKKVESDSSDSSLP